MSDTTTALPLATRDALRSATCECGHPVAEWHHQTRGCTYLGVGTRACPCELDWADALLASGVVRDPAALADDEGLERAVITAGHQIRWEDRPGDIPLQDGVRHTLRALAAALTEDLS